MPKIQIPKEKILDAALKVIIRDGYENMNIKTVANELNKSTQTISWTFGSMEKFREEVYEYALKYANKKMESNSNDPMEEYGKVGYIYINMAFDEPNLILYLRSDAKRLMNYGGFGKSFDSKKKNERIQAFSKMYNCSLESADKFILNMIIYTQGLVSMILLDNRLNIDKEGAHQKLYEIGKDLMKACIIC